MLALVRNGLMMVFNRLSRGSLPVLLQQLKPCSSVLSTLLPQWVQSWEVLKWAPNRRLVAIWIVALHIHSPRELLGGAVSHTPDSFWLQACNQAPFLGLTACWLSRQEKQLSMTNKSQVFCLVAATPVGRLGLGLVWLDRLVYPFSAFDQSLGLDGWKGRAHTCS